MLPIVRSLSAALVLGGGVCLLLGCAETPSAGNSAQKDEAASSRDRGLIAESLPDDAGRGAGPEIVEPLDSEELATLLVSDRRPVRGELTFPTDAGGIPAPKSAAGTQPAGKPAARAFGQQATQPRVGDQVVPVGGAKVPEAKIPETKLFERWPKPKLAIVLSGLQNGYLEPCGCAGLENMKGGLMRRHTFLQSLEDPNGLAWPAVLPVDLGNLAGRYGWQAEQKFDTAVRALKTMKYQAIGYGPDDLRLGPETLILAAADAGGPFVSANVGISGSDDSLLPPYRVIDAGGYKVGITAVLGDKYRRGVTGGDIVSKEAEKGLAEVMPKLLAARCDVLILLSNAEMAETKELIKRFPKFDIVVTAGGPDEPPLSEEKIPGTKTWLIESGRKGMYLQVIGLFEDPRMPRRFQRVPIDARFKDSPEIKKLMLALQKKYEDYYKLGAQRKDKSAWEALGIKPLPHPNREGRTFVGSETCGGCHTKAYAVWEKTPHAKATKTLETLDIPRTYDAECLSCHVTGWEPQKFFPFKSGYESMAKTAHLAHNGCENCHGPGSKHVEIENNPANFTADDRRKAQQGMKLTVAQAKASVCSSCHDLDNSPNYIKNGFDAYWPKVEHKGKD